MKKWLFFLIVFTYWIPTANAFESRETLREAYNALYVLQEDSPYEILPQTNAPYGTGEIRASALDEALDYLNFLRGIADLMPVERSRIYDYRCQHGAVLLAALDYVDHNAPNPGDMNGDFYDSAHLATASSNIAKSDAGAAAGAE